MHLKGDEAADARWQHQSEPAFFPGSRNVMQPWCVSAIIANLNQMDF
jgi:hypothetical protein